MRTWSLRENNIKILLLGQIALLASRSASATEKHRQPGIDVPMRFAQRHVLDSDAIRATICTKLHEAWWLPVGSALEGRCNLPNTNRAIHGTHTYRRCGNNYAHVQELHTGAQPLEKNKDYVIVKCLRIVVFTLYP
jgi:hypothetical protein